MMREGDVPVTTFRQAIGEISSRFYTAEEYPFLSRDRLPSGVLAYASALETEELSLYGAHLKGIELDSLLFDLRDAETSKELQAGLSILRLRFSPRLLGLISRLYQYNMGSNSLLLACRELVREAAQRDSYPEEGVFLWKFAEASDITAALHAAATEGRGDISLCCQTYAIDPKSPLARKSFFQYLMNADKNTLLLNRSWVLSYIEEEEAQELTPLVRNYLSSLTLLEWQDAVALAILQKLGDPYESPDWQPYTKEQRDCMAQWNFLHLLKIYSRDFPQKTEILSRYYNRIRSCRRLPELNLLIIDFGEVVVVDLENQPFSFFCQRSEYEQELKRWESEEKTLPVFLRKDCKLTTARDFMIENKESACIKLSYIGVDRLYIQELMDIKMGIEPDMRASKSK